MSAWRNSARWRPPQFGITMPAEFVPFLIWILPSALGLVLIVLEQIATGQSSPIPERIEQLGIFQGHLAWTLVWSPLWSFPGVLAMFALRLILLTTGRFGWASALLAGAASGMAVPIMLGSNFWLAGPLHGAASLFMHQAIHRARDPSAFDG
jgi:hypothetical protein